MHPVEPQRRVSMHDREYPFTDLVRFGPIRGGLSCTRMHFHLILFTKSPPRFSTVQRHQRKPLPSCHPNALHTSRQCFSFDPTHAPIAPFQHETTSGDQSTDIFQNRRFHSSFKRHEIHRYFRTGMHWDDMKLMLYVRVISLGPRD